jgi:hypothetical protein
VLSNLSIEAMTPLLGGPAAAAASLAVQIGYCLSLMASLLLYMHPVGGGCARAGPAAARAAFTLPPLPIIVPITPDQCFPHPQLRTSLSEMIWGEDAGGAPAAPADAGEDASEDDTGGGGGGGGAAPGGRAALMEAKHYYWLTYGLLAAATLAAISVPNIWAALSAIGAAARGQCWPHTPWQCSPYARPACTLRVPAGRLEHAARAAT